MIDAGTRREIDMTVERLLADVGCAPPVPIHELLRHLRVDLDYYDLADPSLVRRFVHRAKLRGQQLGERITTIAQKIRLHALWCSDEDQIFVDRSIPTLKQKWATFHDTAHRLLPWHRAFFLWDTAQTLDPAYQDVLEAEANYGASAIMFCGAAFTREALDTVPTWKSVAMLAKRHQASLAATLRRYVAHGHDRAMLAVISTPWWQPVPKVHPSRHRHIDVSPRFAHDFGSVSNEVVGAIVSAHTSYASGGPVGDFVCTLADRRGDAREFRGECFFNRYDLLTLLVEQRRPIRTSIALTTRSRP